MPTPPSTPRPQQQAAPSSRRWMIWSVVAAGYLVAVAFGAMGRSGLAGATLGVAIIATVKQIQPK